MRRPGPRTDGQLAELFERHVALRERALWELLRDTGMPAPVALSLDASAVARTAWRLGRAHLLAVGLAAVRAVDRAGLPY